MNSQIQLQSIAAIWLQSEMQKHIHCKAHSLCELFKWILKGQTVIYCNCKAVNMLCYCTRTLQFTLAILISYLKWQGLLWKARATFLLETHTRQNFLLDSLFVSEIYIEYQCIPQTTLRAELMFYVACIPCPSVHYAHSQFYVESANLITATNWLGARYSCSFNWRTILNMCMVIMSKGLNWRQVNQIVLAHEYLAIAIGGH